MVKMVKVVSSLGPEQKEFLQKVLQRDGGRWVYSIGYEDHMVKRILDIIDCGRYDSFDQEGLNDIRKCWIDNIGMRI
jgi:hypothetical protein